MRRSPPLTFNTQPPWIHCGGEEKRWARTDEEEEEKREEETAMAMEQKKRWRRYRWYIDFLTLKKRSCEMPIVARDYLQFFRRKKRIYKEYIRRIYKEEIEEEKKCRRRRRRRRRTMTMMRRRTTRKLSVLFFGRRCTGARE